MEKKEILISIPVYLKWNLTSSSCMGQRVNVYPERAFWRLTVGLVKKNREPSPRLISSDSKNKTEEQKDRQSWGVKTSPPLETWHETKLCTWYRTFLFFSLSGFVNSCEPYPTS